MSDVEIRSGGLVEVDTASLRTAAAHARGLAADADEIAERVSRAADGLPHPDASWAGFEAERARSAAYEAAEEARDLARALDETAARYETVELLVQRAAGEASGDAELLARADARLRAIARAHVLPYLLAREDVAHAHPRAELERQAWWTAFALGPLASTLPLSLGVLGLGIDALARGRVPAGARLIGPPDPVHVRRVAAGPVAPPGTLASAAARIPSGTGVARVRVERYAMPGGGREFALYVAGTQGFGGREPFDVRSNLQLYAGMSAASSGAVAAALRDAGARPGDVVHAFGHSQGAMVTERLALEGEYDVRTLVSFGSPVQADAGAGTLAVNVRHTDDPVAALQGGGYAAPVGAPGGFVAERVADPAPGVHDAGLPAHAMSAYAETAALLDASADPRMDRVRAVLADLARAEAVVARDYAAERISRSNSGAG